MALADIPEPTRVQDLGIPPSLVLDIAVRRILREGQTTTTRIAERLRISPVLADQIIEKLRHDRMIEIQGAEGRSYVLQLSEPGRQFAVERMEASKYTGALPVSLADYKRVVTAQHHRPDITPESLRASFSDLVISDDLFAQLGPAIHTPGAIFMYGPPGTGKTSIAERMINTEHDAILVPHAVEVDSQIITVYDPMIHETVDPQPERLDRRWVLCQRPSVLVGGELQANQLDLNYQPSAGVYLAPLQMIANNGVLTVDDFGRQTLTPEQLLNRWIVPLDRDVDFLSLDYGAKFEVPFLTKIVFATNLDPAQLADEAFYRRMGSKILVPPIEDAAFDEVLRRVVEQRGIRITAEAPALLRKGSRVMGDGDLRPYLPGAIATLVTSIAAFQRTEPIMDRPTLERALQMFFSTEDDMRGTSLRTHGVRETADDPVGGHPPAEDDNASVRLFDLVLAATEELLWVGSQEAARHVSEELIRDLGLVAAPVDATAIEVVDVDLSFGSGEVLRVQRPADHRYAALVEQRFRRYVEAGTRSLTLSAGDTVPGALPAIDPTSGLVTGSDASQLVGRLGVGDFVLALRFTDEASDQSAEQRRATLGRILREQLRARDRAVYLADGTFLVAAIGLPDREPPVVLERLAAAWADGGSDDGRFAAGYARAGELPEVAVGAALEAVGHAVQTGSGTWVSADTAA